MNFDTEKKYLLVKEKLDFLRLPTVFPTEATALLYSLINLVPNGSGAQQASSNQSSGNDSQKVRMLST